MTTSATAGEAEVGLLWLAALQRALGRASHDVKDSLNGVAVNLEVVRSRAAKPDTPASAVAVFAEAAAHQLERLTSLIEAVLALGRPERDPADVALALRRIAQVCSASSSSADAAVELREAADGMGAGTVTRVRGEVVRLALIAPLLEAVTGIAGSGRASSVQCTIGGSASHVLVRIDAPGRRPTMPEAVAAAVRAGGVSWTEGPQDISLAFPRA
jgi:signal transduction histidine kinase